MRRDTNMYQCGSRHPLLAGAEKSGRLLAAILISVALLGCSAGAKIDNHGHLLRQSDLQQIQPGMSQSQVKLTLGTPDTTSTIGGGVYYYMSSKTQRGPFVGNRVIERRVVAVYFDESGGMQKIANYGLKDGKLFDFIGRETPSHGKDQSLLKQLFRNLGSRQIYGE